jgi:hypothetical protein
VPSRRRPASRLRVGRLNDGEVVRGLCNPPRALRLSPRDGTMRARACNTSAWCRGTFLSRTHHAPRYAMPRPPPSSDPSFLSPLPLSLSFASHSHSALSLSRCGTARGCSLCA